MRRRDRTIRTKRPRSAQRNTRDADGDGVYCESLPCPCLKPEAASPPPPSAPPPPPNAVSPPPPPSSQRRPSSDRTNPVGCKRFKSVQRLQFSRTKYPNIYSHWVRATAKGWPKIMIVNRRGADRRRSRLLAKISPRAGFDREEYPAAVGRGKANGKQRGLIRGINPVGWMADVEYVPSSENRSHGSSLDGSKLRRLCNGTRFRYVFTGPAVDVLPTPELTPARLYGRRIGAPEIGPYVDRADIRQRAGCYRPADACEAAASSYRGLMYGH